jgi:hypothetical protein
MTFEKAHYGPRRDKETEEDEGVEVVEKVLATLKIKRSHLLILGFLATTGGFTGVASFIQGMLNDQAITKTNTNVAVTKQDSETTQHAAYKATDEVVDELASSIKKLEDANNANLEKDREQDELLVELKDPEARRYRKKRKPIPPPVVTRKPSLPATPEAAVIEQKEKVQDSTQDHPLPDESPTPE